MSYTKEKILLIIPYLIIVITSLIYSILYNEPLYFLYIFFGITPILIAFFIVLYHIENYKRDTP